MTWSDIWRIILASVSSLGGIVFIVSQLVKFSANSIAEKLEKRYELKLNKELESYKATLSSKNYISKTRFDAEFAIYRELSLNFAELIRQTSSIVTIGTLNVPDLKKFKEEYIDPAIDLADSAQVALYKNYPFIPKEISDCYDELLRDSRTLIQILITRYYSKSKQKWTSECFCGLEDLERNNKLTQLWEKHINTVREYLAGLDVLGE